MLRRIISIHGRSSTGISRPFLCDDEEGQSYFVKRNNITRNQLVLEYLIGKLAFAFKLPVVPFDIVEIPTLLSSQTLPRDRQDFEPGLAFGSRRVPFCEDVNESHLRQIPDDLKIKIICFDWWTGNSDRCLTMLGRSPNLLWDPSLQSIGVIDHDRTQDQFFDPGEFIREHVFRDVRPFLERSTAVKYRNQFENAVPILDKAWKELPHEWVQDDAGDPIIDFSLESLKNSLFEPTLSVFGFLRE